MKRKIYVENIPNAIEGLRELYKTCDNKVEFVSTFVIELIRQNIDREIIRKIIEELVRDDPERDKILSHFDSENRFILTGENQSYFDFKHYLQSLGEKKYSNTPTPREWGIYTAIKAIDQLDTFLGTSIGRSLAIAPVAVSGDYERYFVNEPNYGVYDYGIYELIREGNRITINYIFRFFIDEVTIYWSQDPKKILYDISFSEPSDGYSFRLQSMSIKQIADIIASSVYGIRDKEKLLVALSSIIDELRNKGIAEVVKN